MIRRRIILSSFIFALFSPASAVLAQNECGPGPTAECDQATYANGITYNSAVDLSVTKTNSDDTTVDANGVNLTGTGAASVSWDSSIGTLVGGSMTDGPVLDALTNSGDITLNTLNVFGSAATVTHGIRARSTGGGDILIDASHGARNSRISGLIGVEAVSQGGNGDIEVRLGRSAEGEDYGVFAEVEGAGNLTVSTSYFRSSVGLNDKGQIISSGTAALYAKTGTGLLTLDARIGGSGSAAGAIIDAGGDVMFTGSATAGSGQYGIDLLNVAAGTTSTLNLTSDTSVRALGDGDLIVNIVNWPQNVSFGQNYYGDLNFDFDGMADRVPVSFRDGGIWRVTGTGNVVPEGNYDVSIQRNGMLVMWEEDELTFDGSNPAFSVGEGGYFVVDARSHTASESFASEARIDGLSEFRHAGRILLGSSEFGGKRLPGELPDQLGDTSLTNTNKVGSAFINSSDGDHDDVLVMPGVNWIGEGGEVWMDVELGKSQDSCAARDPSTEALAAGDCLMLPGASTEGVTYLTLFDRFQYDLGRLNDASRQGILLVDVSGGSSAQGHFVVGPNTVGYSPAFGGSWDRGLFQYVVAYDEDAQQHRLVGMLNGTAFQQAPLAATSHDLWRLSTANWLGQQADRRSAGQGRNRDVWLRVSRESADRDLVGVQQTGAGSFEIDHSFDRSSLAVTTGLDLLAGGAGDKRWAVGTMLGYVTADVDYDAIANSVEFNGWTLGAYASYASGSIWLDAAVNFNDATMRQHVPVIGEFRLSNDLTSLGGQVDAGWRLSLTEKVFVEPLATLSYVRTRFDDLSLDPADPVRLGLDLEWNDPTSFRAGIGGRIGLDHDFSFMQSRIAFVARVLNEFDGESVVTIHNNAFPEDPDIEVADTFDDTLTELAVEASMHSRGGAVSGFVNLGSTTASEYDAFTAKLGVRYQW